MWSLSKLRADNIDKLKSKKPKEKTMNFNIPVSKLTVKLNNQLANNSKD